MYNAGNLASRMLAGAFGTSGIADGTVVCVLGHSRHTVVNIYMGRGGSIIQNQVIAPDHTPAVVPRSRAGRNRLSPPRNLTELVERSLVLRSLDVARAGRLTQVVGPPGSGKTVVLAQWRERLLGAGAKVAWCTMSEREAEPAAFLAMLARAIDFAGLSMVDTGLFDIPDVEPRAALDSILLKLELSQVELVIIIDAFDCIDSPRMATCIEELVSTAPDTVHVVLATRRRPQVATAALRAHGFVRSIESNELQLSIGEISQILHLPEDAPEVAVVAERTGGWAVAVDLYRIWRSRTGLSDNLTPLFTSQVSEVADYLTEQVFATLDPEHQVVLIELSIIDYITPGLADWVRQTSGSAQMLEDIQAALPGLVERGAVETEPTYRIHPLLMDYARARLQYTMAAAHKCDLHYRAATWFESHQRYVEALPHARASGNEGFVARMLAGLRPFHIFLASGAGELRAILRVITPELLAPHPRLQLMAALAHFKAGFFLEANAMLKEVKARTLGFSKDPYGNERYLQVEGRILEFLFSAHIDGPECSSEILDSVIEIRRWAHDDPLMWAATENLMIVIHEHRGNLSAAQDAVLRTRAIYQSQNALHFAVDFLLNHDVLISLAHGDLHIAADLSSALRRRQSTGLSSDAPTLAMTRIANAVTDYERKFNEGAADAVRQGLDQLGESEAWFEHYALCYVVIADVAYRRGGVAALRKCVDEARNRTHRIGVGTVDRFLAAVETGYLVRAGQLAAARPAVDRLLKRQEAWKDGWPSSWRERDAVATALALWSIAAADFEAALRGAQALVDEGLNGGRRRTHIKGLVLMTLTRCAEGDRAAAATLMEEALRLTMSDGHVAVFAEEGDAILPALESVIGDEAAMAAVRRHAEAVARTISMSRRDLNALNEREAQIVALLAEGASNKLIGRKLSLSENTIKFHLKKIFAKLGVTSRKAVVEVSRNRPL